MNEGPPALETGWVCNACSAKNFHSNDWCERCTLSFSDNEKILPPEKRRGKLITVGGRQIYRRTDIESQKKSKRKREQRKPTKERKSHRRSDDYAKDFSGPPRRSKDVSESRRSRSRRSQKKSSDSSRSRYSDAVKTAIPKPPPPPRLRNSESHLVPSSHINGFLANPGHPSNENRDLRLNHRSQPVHDWGEDFSPPPQSFLLKDELSKRTRRRSPARVSERSFRSERPTNRFGGVPDQTEDLIQELLGLSELQDREKERSSRRGDTRRREQERSASEKRSIRAEHISGWSPTLKKGLGSSRFSGKRSPTSRVKRRESRTPEHHRERRRPTPERKQPSPNDSRDKSGSHSPRRRRTRTRSDSKNWTSSSSSSRSNSRPKCIIGSTVLPVGNHLMIHTHIPRPCSRGKSCYWLNRPEGDQCQYWHSEEDHIYADKRRRKMERVAAEQRRINEIERRRREQYDKRESSPSLKGFSISLSRSERSLSHPRGGRMRSFSRSPARGRKSRSKERSLSDSRSSPRGENSRSKNKSRSRSTEPSRERDRRKRSKNKSKSKSTSRRRRDGSNSSSAERPRKKRKRRSSPSSSASQHRKRRRRRRKASASAGATYHCGWAWQDPEGPPETNPARKRRRRDFASSSRSRSSSSKRSRGRGRKRKRGKRRRRGRSSSSESSSSKSPEKVRRRRRRSAERMYERLKNRDNRKTKERKKSGNSGSDSSDYGPFIRPNLAPTGVAASKMMFGRNEVKKLKREKEKKGNKVYKIKLKMQAPKVPSVTQTQDASIIGGNAPVQSSNVMKVPAGYRVVIRPAPSNVNANANNPVQEEMNTNDSD